MLNSWIWVAWALYRWAATCRALKLAQPVQLTLQSSNGETQTAQILPAQFGDMPYGRQLQCDLDIPLLPTVVARSGLALRHRARSRRTQRECRHSHELVFNDFM